MQKGLTKPLVQRRNCLSTSTVRAIAAGVTRIPGSNGMKHFFWLSSSRVAQACMAALITLVLAGTARADTIDLFDVLGTALNVSGASLDACASQASCSFSGLLTADVTATASAPNGAVTAIDITFPGLSAFDFLTNEGPIDSSGWFADPANNDGDLLRLDFTTTPTPGSLVGFNGGIITGDIVVNNGETVYSNVSGTLTLVPEPSSLALLGLGLLFLAGLYQQRSHRLPGEDVAANGRRA